MNIILNIKNLIKQGRNQIQENIDFLPDLMEKKKKEIISSDGSIFSITDYSEWRFLVEYYTGEVDWAIGIKVKELFNKFEEKFEIRYLAEIIANLKVAQKKQEEWEQKWNNPNKTVSPENDNINPELNQNYMENKKSKVFIVHGHDEKLIAQTKSLVMELGFEPVILREQANRGQTIIQKFKEHSDVDFAIVLYTACDEGRDINENELKPRARQNVVFEHGYLCAKLGNAKVCALLEDGVEIPGDLAGVVYIPIDPNGAWRYAIAKEMNADMNKLK